METHLITSACRWRFSCIGSILATSKSLRRGERKSEEEPDWESTFQELSQRSQEAPADSQIETEVKQLVN